MASKQLGKLRQWAGEVISSREKTIVSEEFAELEKDIELRKVGAERLLLASELYHHALQKKKDCIALPDPEKLLPIDSLGIIMITHGEEFGDHSDFGTSLVNFGRAHCKIATLQEAYAVTFRDTFLASIEKFQEDIKEYDATKKKLESRRLTYDAAISKLEKIKNGKKEKEKERAEAEDELEIAKARYDETTEDLRAHIHSIQETEVDQLRELTAFLDLEMNFVEQYLEVLKETKSEWAITGPVRSTARGRDPSAHALHRKSPASKSTSLKRNTSIRSSVPSTAILDSTDDEEDHPKTSGRRASTVTRSSSVASRPAVPSRPSSRASRKRTDSTSAPKDADEKFKEDKNEKDNKHAKRMSVSGWASNAMGSFSGRGKKAKDKDTFTTLDDDENSSQKASEDVEQNGHASPGHKSQKSLTSLPGSLRGKSSKSKERGSPQIPSRILKPPSMQEKKVVRALYDFSGSADELSFRVGDEIVVVNEVLEGWWMGELRGKQGLFPTPYTEVVPGKPPLPSRPDLKGSRPHSSQAVSTLASSRDSISSNSDNDNDDYYEPSDNEVYGSQPLSPNHSPFFGGTIPQRVGRPDDASIASIDHDQGHTDRTNLVAAISRYQQDHSTTSSTSSLATRNTSTNSFSPIKPSAVRRLSAAEGLSSGSMSNLISTGKKAPPPPPPRRSTTAVGNTASPPIPARSLSGFSGLSGSGSGSAPLLFPPSSITNSNGNNITPGSSVGSLSLTHSPTMMYDTSPFESSSELSHLNGKSEGEGAAASSAQGCTEFKQNPFKAKGFCSNCFQFH